VDEVVKGTGSWGRKPQEDLLAGLTPGRPPPDADGDGLPDEWEAAHGLDAADSADHAKVMPSGYTAIEEYAAELAERLIAAASEP
jgi:hypothetical protein